MYSGGLVSWVSLPPHYTEIWWRQGLILLAGITAMERAPRGTDHPQNSHN